MKIDVLTNRSIRSLKAELATNLLSCDSFRFASAFISQEVLEIFEDFLRRNKKRDRHGQVIIGLYNGFNSLRALKAIQQIAVNSRGRIQVSISTDLNFHWKYYQFRKGTKRTIYVGSANLTKAGLEDNAELQCRIVCIGKDQGKIGVFDDEYQKQFESAIDITQFPLSEYRENRIGFRYSLPSKLSAFLKRGKNSKSKRISEVSGIILLKYELSRRTDKLVSENKSEWDKRNWDWYCNRWKWEFTHEGVKGRVFLMIDRTGNRYSFCKVQIMDAAVLKTQDGQYFIAYKRVGAIRRNDKELRPEFERNGIYYHSHGFNCVYKLSKSVRELIDEYF